MLSIKKQEILTYERKIDFPMIVASEEPSVLALKKDFDSLFNFVVMCCGHYLEMCFPSQVNLAPVIANDLIERNPSWKALDFINLFKFFRQRQDLEGIRIFGNTITPMKIMEMATVYEDHRAAALEQFHAKKKGNLSEENKSLPAQKLLEKFTVNKDENLVIRDAGMGNDFDRTQAERERTGKDVSYPNQVPDENYFRKNFNQ